MAYLTDCETCMQNTTKQQRQVNGCGYEPALDPASRELDPWMPPTGSVGFQVGKASKQHPRGELAPNTCAGYTTKLPEVVEGSRASSWLKRGDLRAFVADETPTEGLVLAIDVYDGASVARDNYYMTPPDKGGGAG